MIFNIFFAMILALAFGLSLMIARADFRRRIIPDAYLFPLMLTGLALIAFFDWPHGLSAAVIGGIFGYTLAAITGFAFDYYLRKQGDDNISAPIGMGDIKLIGVGGLWLGTDGLAIALVIACISGMIWARIRHQRFIPFAPFFLIGAFFGLLNLAISL